jgi:hypothetical protein
MSDMNSPMINRPHSARDRTTPLFQGLSVNHNSGHSNQQTNFLAKGNEFSVQENLHKNLFKASKAAATIDNVPQSPVSTPSRKIIKHQRSAQKIDYGSLVESDSTEIDYNAPYEEFELFDTLWHVYWTEEGYTYYLDTQTQHSQWDDPRTHGILHYDEITGDVLTEPTSNSCAIGDDKDIQDFNARDDAIKLALQQQDSFLQPKLLGPKQDFSPSKQPVAKRVQSMKPQKFTANSADMSPFRTDDDSNSDSGVDHFSIPPRGLRTQQLKAGAHKKAFGTPEKDNSSSGDDSDDSDLAPRRQHKKTSIQAHINQAYSSDSDRSVSDESYNGSDDMNSTLDPQFSKSIPREIGSTYPQAKRQEQVEKSIFNPKLHKKAAPKGPRNIPFLSANDMAAYETRREKEDRELERSGGRGAWFDSSEDHNVSSHEHVSEDDAGNDLELSETVSRMVNPPGGKKPIKTNCFSPDKASLQRAEQLQRKVSSCVSSPSRSVSSKSSDEERGSRGNSAKDQLPDVRYLPDGNQVLVGNMQLESDDDDDDDYFDTIITMKKDELASADDDGDENNVASSSDYMNFLNKVENDVKCTTPQKGNTLLNGEEVSLAVDIEHDSDWDEDMELQKKLKLLASAEKEKQIKIFDTSRDGGYGNGGNTLEELKIRNEDDDIQDVTESKSGALHVDTEFPIDTSSTIRPLKLGGDSPFIKSDHGSPNLEVKVRPYLAFLEAGNSVRQVRRQMEKDNQSKDLIKLMIQMSDDVNSSISQSRTSCKSVEDAVPSKATPEELSVLKQDPLIGKYIKMAAMGVPFGNVEHKMKSEGVSAEDMLRVAVALGHGPAPVSGLSLSSKGSTDSRPTSVSRRSSGVSLVKMHWNTLPPEKLENSIWANNDEDSMGEKELQELEMLFAASGSAGPGGNTSESKNSTASAPTSDPRLKLFVLESRRAQNVVIGLSQYKGQKSHREVLEAVCRLDDLGGSLNIDKLQNLLPLLPTLHEAKKMSTAQESQHPAEVFFNTAVTYYPELLNRLHSFLTCLTFADTSEQLLGKMRRIIEACNEV